MHTVEQYCELDEHSVSELREFFMEKEGTEEPDPSDWSDCGCEECEWYTEAAQRCEHAKEVTTYEN
jgi:hypothetical protein